MPKKKTQQEFKLEVQLNHPNIIVSGEYINAKTNVHCKCKICNYEWNTTPDNLHSGKGCPQCGGTLKLSQEDFILRIKKLHNNVTILSKYKNAKSKVFCKCNICNYEWHPIASDLLHGSNCPNCAGNMTKETQNFIDELKNINPNVKIIGKYINNKTKILCNCNLCHQNFDTSPSNLLKGCYHEECAHKIGADKQRKSQMDFENDVHNIFPDLKVLGEYKNNSSRIKVKCEKCNHEWSPYASNLMSGCGCPKCASSKGEKSISKFFDDHKIDYQTQYRINECRNKNPLPFDFAVFNNNKLQFLIEYDGKQHYEPWNKITNADQELLEIQKRDKIKTTYCEDNDIKLIRIPYWDFNKIEDILIKELYLKSNSFCIA